MCLDLLHQDLSCPDALASLLPADDLWLDDAFGGAGQSQVVPDVTNEFELDLSGVAAGLQQHCPDVSPPGWAPCRECHAEFAGLLKPNFTQHDSSCRSPPPAAAAELPNPLVPACKAAAVQQQYTWSPVPTQAWQQQQQQQQLMHEAQSHLQQLQQVPQPTPDMQWVPQPATHTLTLLEQQPQQQQQCSPQASSVGATAASMVPLVFPPTPAATEDSPAPSRSSSTISSPVGSMLAAVNPPAQCRSGQGQWRPVPAAESPQLQQTPLSSSVGSAGSSRPGASHVVPSVSPTAAAAAAATANYITLLGPAVRSRAEALLRYRLKRASRGAAVQRVRYQRRKEYAEQRPRVRGRFVKRSDLQPRGDEVVAP